MIIAKTFASFNLYLLQQINIHWNKKNSEYSILADPDVNEIAIGTYKQEIFPKLILIDVVYITSSLNCVKVEVVDIIQHLLFTREIPPYEKQFNDYCQQLCSDLW